MGEPRAMGFEGFLVGVAVRGIRIEHMVSATARDRAVMCIFDILRNDQADARVRIP